MSHPEVQCLDDPGRYAEIRRTLFGKKSLVSFYKEIYAEYADCLRRCPEHGVALEIGSGAGFAKDEIPEMVTSDILLYDGVERVIDGTVLPYENQSLRMICVMNVFHHIPDVAAFLGEAERCLVPGGRILIADQHLGHLSKHVLKHLHHEPFDPDAAEWRFDSQGPLTGANGALAWMVFVRDIEKFESLFPHLSLVRYQPHSPLRYWLAGGLKNWNLLPGCLYNLAKTLDNLLIAISRNFGSFTYVELVKTH
jgi:SAM-dependent methyltransferase